jgi:phage terminase large subunit-like protein
MPRKHKPAYSRLELPALDKLKKKALDDPWAFIDLIDFHGGCSRFESIHRELLRFLTDTWERRLVLMPRGHFKSTICSALYVLWRIYRDPNIRILVGCSVKELATGFVREVKQYLEDPELQKYVWNSRPHIGGNLIPDIDRQDSKRRRGTKYRGNAEDGEWVDPDEFGGNDRKVLWRANAIQVIRPEIFKEPTLYACSVGMQVTGWHFDLIIMDDIVTFENSDTPDKAKKILSWVMDMESIINPREGGLGDEFVVLGTRYYKWDYYGTLLGTDLDEEEAVQDFIDTQNDDHLHIIKRDIYGNGCQGLYQFGMEELEGLTAEDGYLCPKLMDEARERKLRRRLGTRRFNSQYMNKIMSEEDQLFSYESINFYTISNLSEYLTFQRLQIRDGEDPVFITPVCCVDPGASLNPSANYTAIAVGGVTDKDLLIMLDIRYGHWTPSQMADKIQEVLEKWNLKRVVIENAGQQVAIINTIKERWLLNQFNAYIAQEIPKGDKKQKILDALEPVFESGSLWMPTHMAGMKEIKDEITFFPASGVRDDVLDVMEKVKRYAPKTSVQSVERRRNRRGEKRQVNQRYGGYR